MPGEWLCADGLGGYAMGTADGIRTRRYHSLLLVAAPDSERRFVLVNGVEAWLETGRRRVPLTAQRYVPDVVHPTGVKREQGYEIFGVHGHAATVLRWRVDGNEPARLRVRLLLSGRDWHTLHHENSAFRFDAMQPAEGQWRFEPYPGVPPVVVNANARYEHAPTWFRQFQYDEERARGQDFIEDLASPGEFVFELSASKRDAALVLTTSPEFGGLANASGVDDLRGRERRRIGSFASGPVRAADAYIVSRGSRRTIIAGYPWFTDWGRDTFISLPGLCLVTGRVDDAKAILLSWCAHLSDGMMPNLFPSRGSKPEYNSVDAALWFVIAVRELSGAIDTLPMQLTDACEEILARYSRGTRFGIRMDRDGLLAAGAPGVALTWMDAIVDGVPVTPRMGKPVEVQALWINALEFAASRNRDWGATAARARESFAQRFWNEKRGCLFDVVDVNHTPGAVDDCLRPNQVFACGGLPVAVVEGARAQSIVDVVAKALLTPVGLRSLAPSEPGYVGKGDGPLRDRDRGYHQGTVWPWLSYAFLDAWSRANGGTIGAARHRWIPDFDGAYEIADGDPPHEPRGCPFQAWTLAAMLRIGK